MINFPQYIINYRFLGTKIYYIGTISMKIRIDPLKDSMGYD